MESLDQALAWAVRTFDARFGESASMVSIHLDQVMVVVDVDTDTWKPQWEATVNGIIFEGESNE